MSCLTGLRDLSKERVDANEEFIELLEDIEQYKIRKARKSVTLNEEKFMAERKEFDSEKETKNTFEELSDSSDEVFAKSFYNDEALEIARWPSPPFGGLRLNIFSITTKGRALALPRYT